MKFLSDQRRLYLLAAVLLALTIILCFAWRLWSAPPSDTPIPTATPGVPVVTPLPIASKLPDATEKPAATATVSTIVYYQDNNGYLVPVMKQIENQQGIAKATLSLMVSSPRNDMEAARLGLRTVLPEGTDIDLDISGGTARVDLSDTVKRLPDAEAETNMVNAIVQTLTEFDTVRTVQFLIDGQQVSTLAHGTSVGGEFSRGMLNLESVSASLDPEDAQTVMLYFPGETGSLIVPVSRMVYGEADINTAILELVKGPGAASPLDNTLPSGCGLIDVKTDKSTGKVTINFTQDFIRIAEQADGGRQALKALMLTCSQFPGVTSVEIMVEGVPYDTGVATSSIPTTINIADEIADQFLATQAALLFEQ
ncbi:MAG: GerMN domain-containing protein [Clostridia bacterium]|nr:GerMN domain-containing protein [Clostridia bacterium]